MLKAIPVTFCAGLLRIDLGYIREDYDDYCEQSSDRSEAENAGLLKELISTCCLTKLGCSGGW